MLGYIPAFPYWLYNISTFLTIPIFVISMLIINKNYFSFEEIFFLFLYILSLLLSYLFSDIGFNFSGFLRAVVPVLFYYLVRLLQINKTKYFDILYFLLVLSFLFAFYQFFFQPLYEIGDDGNWIVRDSASEMQIIFKRTVSFLGNSNVFGVFSVATFLILWLDYKQFISKPNFIFLCIILGLNIIVMGKSRTSMLALIMAIFIINFNFKNIGKLFKILFFLILCSLFIYYNYEKLEFLDALFRLSALTETDQNSYSLRKDIANFSMDLISKNLIFGIGAGNEGTLFSIINAPHKGMESGSLLLLLERGLFGYFFYLYVIVFEFLLKKNTILNIILGLTIVSVDFTETVYVLPQLTTFLAVYLAVRKNNIILN